MRISLSANDSGLQFFMFDLRPIEFFKIDLQRQHLKRAEYDLWIYQTERQTSVTCSVQTETAPKVHEVSAVRPAATDVQTPYLNVAHPVLS